MVKTGTKVVMRKHMAGTLGRIQEYDAMRKKYYIAVDIKNVSCTILAKERDFTIYR